MVVLAFTVLIFLVLSQAFVIYGLLNRVLEQAKVQPLALPRRKPEEEPVEPQKPVIRFSVPFMS